MLKKNLLVCGLVFPVLYLLLDISSGLLYTGYDFFSQTVSELSAIGAPTRGLWTAFTFILNPLLIAFGFGVRKASNQNRAIDISGLLIVGWGLLGFLWLFYPMNMRGAIGSTNDTMHLVMVALTIILMLSFMIAGAIGGGRKFCVYSIFLMAVMMIFGIITGQQISNVEANLPTPWMGITERISAYSPMVWVFTFALLLLKKENKA